MTFGVARAAADPARTATQAAAWHNAIVKRQEERLLMDRAKGLTP
jgi:hypothetical protein